MKSERKKYILSIALIIILGALVYANSLKGEFIWDDIAFVRDNTLIRDWTSLAKFFSKNAAKSLAPGGGGIKYNFYRPLHMLTLTADYSVWKLNTFGYHITNTAFHVLAGLAFFWLVTLLFGDYQLSLIASLLFVAHPAHTEAIAFISGRADAMSLFFLLLCFVFYVKHTDTKKGMSGIIALLSCAFALLSRETSAILPFLLLVYHYSFNKKIRPAMFLSIAALAIGYTLFRSGMAKELLLGENIPSLAGAFRRIPGFFAAITNYIRILLLPFGLHMEYGNALFKFSDPKAIGGAAITIFFLIYAVKKRKSDKLIFFSVLWFFIALLPQSNIYPIGAYMAEHWLYLPSLGFFLILAAVIAEPLSTSEVDKRGLPRNLGGGKRFRYPAIIITVLLVAFYSFQTVKQNGYWKELIPFYERTLRYNPESPRLYNNLGVAHHDIKDYEKAIKAYRKSIEIDPTYFETFCNLGTVYHDVKEYAKAEEAYKKEIAINPAYPKVYNNLGALYSDTARYEEAIEAYKKAITLKPDQMETYFNLGLACQNAGKYKESISAYEKAIELNPNYPNAYNDIGVTHHKAGEYEKAIASYKRAIELMPDRAEIYANLGLSYRALGKENEAVGAFKKAETIRPK